MIDVISMIIGLENEVIKSCGDVLNNVSFEKMMGGEKNNRR